MKYGVENGRAVLDEQKVRRIRLLDGLYSHQRIADWAGCSRRLISKVVRREVWAHLPDERVGELP